MSLQVSGDSLGQGPWCCSGPEGPLITFLANIGHDYITVILHIVFKYSTHNYFLNFISHFEQLSNTIFYKLPGAILEKLKVSM